VEMIFLTTMEDFILLGLEMVREKEA
jgi:hypothetical protein